METAIVTLKKGEGRSLKAGGAWIYDNEIESVLGGFEDGDIVQVHDFDGYGLGKGFINRHSKIRVRMLTRNPNQEIDPGIFKKKSARCPGNTEKGLWIQQAAGLIFGEADFLPGIVADKFSDVLVIQSLALGHGSYERSDCGELKAALLEDGIRVRGVYERSDAKERENRGHGKG